MAIEKNRDSLKVIERIVRDGQHIEKFSFCFCPCTDEHLNPFQEDEIEKTNEIHEIDWLSFKIMESLGMPIPQRIGIL